MPIDLRDGGVLGDDRDLLAGGAGFLHQLLGLVHVGRRPLLAGILAVIGAVGRVGRETGRQDLADRLRQSGPPNRLTSASRSMA